MVVTRASVHDYDTYSINKTQRKSPKFYIQLNNATLPLINRENQAN